mmetsp:Transcript_82874/g.268561  ORF Transcript_82874/g.268561 Transcript_82874/m.268561 type:complete len:245 (-) Transcript_82874:942-1676(-)
MVEDHALRQLHAPQPLGVHLRRTVAGGAVSADNVQHEAWNIQKRLAIRGTHKVVHFREHSTARFPPACHAALQGALHSGQHLARWHRGLEPLGPQLQQRLGLLPSGGEPVEDEELAVDREQGGHLGTRDEVVVVYNAHEVGSTLLRKLGVHGRGRREAGAARVPEAAGAAQLDGDRCRGGRTQGVPDDHHLVAFGLEGTQHLSVGLAQGGRGTHHPCVREAALEWRGVHERIGQYVCELLRAAN